MIIDTHVHVKHGSTDSEVELEEYIEFAENNNIDGICITDHDSLYWRTRVKDYLDKTDILLIVGVEIYTLDGDLLCYGIDELPNERMSAQDTIDFVKKLGGVVIAAHPYRDNGRGVGDLIHKLNGLDAIEVFNGRTKDINNKIALDNSKRINISISGGSDAHTVHELGRNATFFKVPISSEKDFLSAIKCGEFHPIYL